MPKNFFNRIKESMSSSPKENIPMGDKEHDFERAKDVLFSSKNLKQLVSAIKYINNFNKKYRINEKSPEFIYFGRMIKLMKRKLRSTRFKIDDELDESLEWTDKDGSFDGKDKSFENDPDWKNDESWSSNPERSYWKQGDAGGSTGGGDMNESQDLDWIKDVSDRLPTYDQRTRVDLKDFLLDYAEDNLSVIDFLHNEDLYVPTEDYRRRYTPEEWDEHGTDQWKDGVFKEHGRWIDDPWVTSWELMEELEMGCSKWEFIERTTEDYDLEGGSYDDLFIFKRRKDGRYFALGVRGDSYNGMNDNQDFLYEVFPRMKLVYESRKKLIKKILKEGDFDWLKDTKEHANYKGHPQGIVLLRDHQEIDRFCDIIDEYNGEVVDNARDWLHTGLEDRRDELESMSAEDNHDYGEAVLSVSFFVEKRHPGKITLGYWPYDIIEDELSIKDWLDGDYTFNRDYEIYNNLNQVEKIFKNYQNPELD